MIADILFEVAWKSTIVAACLVALLVFMRRQTPANRTAVGGLGFIFLLLLPLLVAGADRLPEPILEMAAPERSSLALPAALQPEAQVGPMISASVDSASREPFSQTSMILLWMMGSLAVSLRLLAGLVTLRRWTADAEPLDDSKWRGIARRCGVPSNARLGMSEQISSPLSWGWRNPAILINRETFNNAAEAEAVVAHEAAHLNRGDWPRLIAVRLVVALFWFNPFVWLLERLHLQDIEEAADAEATRLVDPTRYAQVLLNVARSASVPAGANSISSGSLAKRIQRVLRGRVTSRWERLWRIGALAGATVVAIPIAVVQLVAPAVSAAATMTPAQTPTPIESARPVDGRVLPASPLAAVAPTPIAVASTAVPKPTPTATTLVVSVAAPAIVAPAVPNPTPVPTIDPAEIERIKRAAEAMAAQSQVIARDSKLIAERAMADARNQMLRGADQMDQGAVQMRKGAATMREEARKLRDPAYRAKVIAENAARGQHTTDQELIDAIPKMEAGADEMEKGIDDMKRGAAKMREEARKQN